MKLRFNACQENNKQNFNKKVEIKVLRIKNN